MLTMLRRVVGLGLFNATFLPGLPTITLVDIVLGPGLLA